MGIKDLISKVLRRDKAEPYIPNRESIDRVYDAEVRRNDFYKKKLAIPKLKEENAKLDREAYGNNLSAGNSILKTPNHFKRETAFDVADREINRQERLRRAKETYAKARGYAQKGLSKADKYAYERLKALDNARRMKLARARSPVTEQRARQGISRAFFQRQAYQNQQSDYNILHTPNHFTNPERYQANNILSPSGNDILKAPNYFKGKKGGSII